MRRSLHRNIPFFFGIGIFSGTPNHLYLDLKSNIAPLEMYASKMIISSSIATVKICGNTHETESE
jgi:hypothetical protein